MAETKAKARQVDPEDDESDIEEVLEDSEDDGEAGETQEDASDEVLDSNVVDETIESEPVNQVSKQTVQHLSKPVGHATHTIVRKTVPN